MSPSNVPEPAPRHEPCGKPCYVRDAARTRYRVYDRVYDRLPVGPGGSAAARRATVVGPGHPAAVARVFVREGDRRQFVVAFPLGAGVPPTGSPPTDVRQATLAVQVRWAVRRAAPDVGPDAERRATAAAPAPPDPAPPPPPLRFVDDEGTTWRVYDARETAPPGGDPPPGRGRVTLAEYRELLEREVPRPPVRVLPPGHPAATHRLFVRAGDRWRFDCRLPRGEVGDCAERTLRAQIRRALAHDPSPRGLAADEHRARRTAHRAHRAARAGRC